MVLSSKKRKYPLFFLNECFYSIVRDKLLNYSQNQKDKLIEDFKYIVSYINEIEERFSMNTYEIDSYSTGVYIKIKKEIVPGKERGQLEIKISYNIETNFFIMTVQRYEVPPTVITELTIRSLIMVLKSFVFYHTR